jgi:hypothetical protein
VNNGKQVRGGNVGVENVNKYEKIAEKKLICNGFVNIVIMRLYWRVMMIYDVIYVVLCETDWYSRTRYILSPENNSGEKINQISKKTKQ